MYHNAKLEILIMGRPNFWNGMWRFQKMHGNLRKNTRHDRMGRFWKIRIPNFQDNGTIMEILREAFPWSSIVPEIRYMYFSESSHPIIHILSWKSVSNVHLITTFFLFTMFIQIDVTLCDTILSKPCIITFPNVKVLQWLNWLAEEI